MIDFKHAMCVFKKFVQDFDSQYGKIDLKIRHTYGVVKASEYIASKLKLSSEDIELAKLIALLHDIGRFEQIRKSDSFIEEEGNSNNNSDDKKENYKQVDSQNSV